MKSYLFILFIFANGKPGKPEESIGYILRTAIVEKGKKLYSLHMKDQDQDWKEINKAWKACGFPGTVERKSKNETGFGKTWCYVSVEDFEWPKEFVDIHEKSKV